MHFQLDGPERLCPRAGQGDCRAANHCPICPQNRIWRRPSAPAVPSHCLSINARLERRRLGVDETRYVLACLPSIRRLHSAFAKRAASDRRRRQSADRAFPFAAAFFLAFAWKIGPIDRLIDRSIQSIDRLIALIDRIGGRSWCRLLDVGTVVGTQTGGHSYHELENRRLGARSLSLGGILIGSIIPMDRSIDRSLDRSSPSIDTQRVLGMHSGAVIGPLGLGLCLPTLFACFL